MEQNENYRKGCEAFDNKNYASAIQYFTTYLLAKPDSIDVLAIRSAAYLRLDDFDNCNQDLILQTKILTKQRKQSPDSCDILIKRGEIYRYLGRNKMAAADFKKAIALNPQCVEAYIGLGYIKSVQGNNELTEALNQFLKALALCPDNSQALFNVASVYSRLEQMEKAVEYYLKCIKTRGDYLPLAYRSLAGVYSKLNSNEEAIACTEEFLSHHSGFDSDYSRLATYYEKKGDFNEAIVRLNTAVTLDNTNPINYYRLSLAYFKIADFQRALENIDRAISINNQSAYRTGYYLEHKMSVLLKLNKSDEAETTFLP
ncbi:MAG: tetratricopeptide repeat protein [Bacteroidetes bacterium]|nr:tetratricopeptide repeat protein [Bacteroidota bacterium]